MLKLKRVFNQWDLEMSDLYFHKSEEFWRRQPKDLMKHMQLEVVYKYERDDSA